MYKDCSRNVSRPYKASSPPLASKSSIFPVSSSSGKSQVPSSQCSRKSRPFTSSSSHEKIVKSKYLGELKESCWRRDNNLFGCQVGMLDMYEAARACELPSFPHHKAYSTFFASIALSSCGSRRDGRDNQYPIQLSETDVNSWNACKKYGYDPPCVTESSHRTRGSSYYKSRPLTLDEDDGVIDDPGMSHKPLG